MEFEIRLLSLWKFITLVVILFMTTFFLILHLSNSKLNELILIVLGFLVFFSSMIVSAFLSTSSKRILIENGILTVKKTYQIQIDQIEWYNEEKNFLLDGIRIKTSNNKNYFFSVINLYGENKNFQVFKDVLINKSIGHHIIEKTSNQLYHESKFLRHGSTIALILIFVLIVMSFITDIKIDRLRLFYGSMIVLSTFVLTRK